jgi:hypothetical protein
MLAKCLQRNQGQIQKGGRSGRTRTPDRRFWRPLLYQTELHSLALTGVILLCGGAIVKVNGGFLTYYAALIISQNQALLMILKPITDIARDISASRLPIK